MNSNEIGSMSSASGLYWLEDFEGWVWREEGSAATTIPIIIGPATTVNQKKAVLLLSFL